MKKLFCLMFLFCYLNALSPILKEGEDYIVLKKPFVEAKNSVIEIFSYQCIFCFEHHKFQILKKIKEKIPNLNYYLIPVSSMAKNGDEFNNIFSYAQFLDFNAKIDSANELSNAKKIANLYFVLHFEKRKKFNYDEGLKALNIDEKHLQDFLNKEKNFKFFTNYQIANEAALNYGTPSYIVNGKYQINTKNLNTLDDLINIIKELKNYE